MAAEVPMDMISEILHCLPAKSVGRFRCVSKGWLSLLSSRQFICAHQNTLNQNHLIYVSYVEHLLYSLPLDHHEKTVLIPTKLHLNSRYVYFMNLYGSCNGLVLVSSQDFCRNYKLLVLNPTTREFTELPKSRYEVMYDNFTPRFILRGFGYDCVTDDYKVVTISYLQDSYQLHLDYMNVEVYSLRANTWTRVIDTPSDHSFWKSSPGVFVNGFLHWFAKKGSDGLGVILAFSLADENFNEVPSPDVDIVAKDGCKLVVLGGKLAIFLIVEGEVWLMNEYMVKESWTNIVLHGLYEFSMLFHPMTFYYNGKILVVDNNHMLIYDTEKRRFSKKVKISHNLQFRIQGSYVESLVSPKLTGITRNQ